MWRLNGPTWRSLRCCLDRRPAGCSGCPTQRSHQGAGLQEEWNSEGIGTGETQIDKQNRLCQVKQAGMPAAGQCVYIGASVGLTLDLLVAQLTDRPLIGRQPSEGAASGARAAGAAGALHRNIHMSSVQTQVIAAGWQCSGHMT